MKKGQFIETISALADGLRIQGRTRKGRGGRYEHVQDLLDLARELQATLVPVEPNANFRRRLHGELILEAQRRESSKQPTALQVRKAGLLIGAAALGSMASVAGIIIAYVLHNKNGRATHVASG